MRPVTFGLLAVALVVAGAGCGDSYEKVTRDQIKLLNEAADVLAEVKDEASGKAAVARLEELAARAEAGRARAEALGPISKEKAASLIKDQMTELTRARSRFNDAVGRAAKHLPPEGKKALEALEKP